jgi:hypothetical protein
VAELKRRKHAVVARPQKRSTESKDAGRSTAERESAQKSAPESKSELPPFEAESGQQTEVESESPRRRGKHVPAAVHRAVFERDQGRCTYTDALGRRCADPPPRSCLARARLRQAQRARTPSARALPRPGIVRARYDVQQQGGVGLPRDRAGSPGATPVLVDEVDGAADRRIHGRAPECAGGRRPLPAAERTLAQRARSLTARLHAARRTLIAARRQCRANVAASSRFSRARVRLPSTE